MRKVKGEKLSIVFTHVTKSLTTVATLPYWCTKIVNKLVAALAKNMVLSACLSDCCCSRKSGRDKGIYFARVPSIVTNQGEKAQEERRSRWISAIGVTTSPKTS